MRASLESTLITTPHSIASQFSSDSTWHGSPERAWTKK